ncbi:amino acid adenylation domain-containing protein [Mycobacteroides chelonae]|nr:amino acid adenylation domain-containing protein [Mycobacteroides chelonae]
MKADATRRLLSMDLGDTYERTELDAWGNRAALDRPVTSASIPELFAEQVARHPSAVAASCDGSHVSYRGLDEASNRLAHWLVAHGVRPGQRVALLFSRSVEAVVAIMGVLKAGASYVPIDPAVPDARLEFVLTDASPVLAVTTGDLAHRLDGRGLVVLDVGDVPANAETGAVGEGPTSAVLSGEDIAYVIYTSGTTGVPKGVAIAHHNVTRLIRAIDANLQLLPGQVWSQCHSLAFDFSVWEIFGALLHGGRLVVVSDSVVRSPEQFHDLLVDEQVSVLSQTPSAFYALQTVDTSRPRGSQLAPAVVVFGGEALEPNRLKAWFEDHPRSPRLINMYGITETTVHASFREITAEDADGSDSPIGVPLEHLAFAVLDDWMQPVAVDVVGELYVAGAALGCGYLGRAP